jgi:AcrR family transcriptional regulator
MAHRTTPELVRARDSSPRPSVARQRILRTADRLFYAEGIHAVGVQRIVDEADVTRVTFYRHFPSKDHLISAYLDHRAQYDRDQVNQLIARHADNPRQALSELASVLTDDRFAALPRGCPFINSSAEFTGAHPARLRARDHRAWVTAALEGLLAAVGHRNPASCAQQLMMLRTGAVVSGALDDNPNLVSDFLTCWNQLIDLGR